MKSMKAYIYKISKLVLQIACFLYLLIGVTVFVFGFSGLIWSNTAYTCLKSGSYMIASFIAIGSATMGFIGAYEDNFCMLLAYGIILTVSLAVRTITTILMLQLTRPDRSTIEIPSLISGLPGTSSLFIELIYAIIELVLSMCAFALASLIAETNRFTFLNPKLYYTSNDKRLILFEETTTI